MRLLLKIALSTAAVLLLAYLLPGIGIAKVEMALVVAIVLGLLNTLIRPILVILTIPITIITLGLFLLVINAGMVLLADKLIDGFSVDGWLSALIFSVLLSILQGILYRVFGVKKGKRKRD